MRSTRTKYSTISYGSMIHLQYHPHTVYVFRTNINESVPNRYHCLERYLTLDRQLAFVADFLGCASSRHDICACAHHRRPLQPLPSCFSRLAPALLEGEGSHLQRPASDVFYPRFAEVRVVRDGSMIGELLCSSSSQMQWLRSLTSSALVVVVVSLRPLTRRSRPALEGPHGGRHLSVSADLRRVWADSAEPPETPLHEGRAP